MIGDGVVGVAAAGCGGHHVRQRGDAVGQAGVGVQVTADLGLGHQVGELAAERCLDLARVLAQRRRYPVHAEPAVDLLLRARHDQLARLDVEQAVLGQPELLPDRNLADPDVVLPGAGEILQGGAPAVGLNHAQVHLKAGSGADRGLGRAGRDDLCRLGQAGEGGHQRRAVVGGGQDVDVAGGLAHPAQRARPGALGAAGDRADRRDHCGGGVRRDVEHHPAAALADQVDATQQFLLALRAETFQVPKAAGLDGVGELADGADAQFLVELECAFRAESRDPGQLEHPSRDLGAKLLHCLDRAGALVLADLVRDRCADTGYLAEPGGVQQGQVA